MRAKARKNVIDIKTMIEWYEDNIKGLALHAQMLKEKSNLGERFLNRTFANFDKRQDEKAFNKCFAYAERENLFRFGRKRDAGNKNAAGTMQADAMPKFRYNLILVGGYGSGKTHLAAAIANNLVDKAIPVLFDTYIGHLDRIKADFKELDEYSHLLKMKSIPMLVIDDLGKEKKTDWSQQILFDVMNYRYEHYLPTVITTNMNMQMLAAHVEGAVASRLMETSEVVQTASGDFRIGE